MLMRIAIIITVTLGFRNTKDAYDNKTVEFDTL